MRGCNLARNINTCRSLGTPWNPSWVHLIAELGVKISADRCILRKLCLQKFQIFLEVLKDSVIRLGVDGLNSEEK